MTETEGSIIRRRWWLIVLGSAIALIVLLVGGIFAGGWMLDEDVLSSVSMIFTQPPETVWAAIGDYERNPISAYMRRDTIPLSDEDSGPVWKEDIGNTVITIRTIESKQPARLVRSFEDSVVPMTSRVEYLVESEGEGTKVTMNSVTTVSDGTWHVPLFRVMLRLSPDGGSLAYLSDLRAHLNADAKKEDSANDIS